MHRRSFLTLAAAGALTAAAAETSLAFFHNKKATGAVFTGSTPGVAIHGYDPVAYFTQGKPVKGSDAFTHDWNGVAWRFANAQNRDAFAAEPARYAPQYGGYCAYAVSKGYTAKIEPDAWSVVDGKLYLNFDRNVRAIWNKDQPGYIEKANANWPGIEKDL